MIAARYRFHGHGSLSYLYRNGRALRSRHLTIKRVSNARRKTPRFAVVVSKKVHKSAVGRNRIRRRIYECIREELPQLMNVGDVAVIVTSGEVLSMSTSELQLTMKKLLNEVAAA